MEKRVKKEETIGTRILKSRPGSQTELAEQLTKITGKVYTRGAVANWETDRRTINSDDLIALSKALGCSADYLLGLDVQNTGLSPETLKILSDMQKHKKPYYSELTVIGCVQFIDSLIRSEEFKEIGEYFTDLHDASIRDERWTKDVCMYRIEKLMEKALDKVSKQYFLSDKNCWKDYSDIDALLEEDNDDLDDADPEDTNPDTVS